MSYTFTFNGIKSDNFGMYISTPPKRPFPERKATTYSVPGLSGDLVVDENAWKNVQITYKVYVIGVANEDIDITYRNIAAWLVGTAGYCYLTDDYDPNYKMLARVVNGFDMLRNLEDNKGKADIVFDCKPQKYPKTDEVLTGTFYANNPLTLTYPSGTGLLPAYPKIELLNKGAYDFLHVTAGNLTVNIGSTAAINKIVIDFETQSVYNAYNNSKPYYTGVTGSWDMLGDGSIISAYDEEVGQNIITLNAYTRRHAI